MTELGTRLKEARLSKGMSLDDLQKVTKIQKRYLQGIEEGNYNMMPGQFYVRAFIKQYSEAVGLEPEEIFEQYKQEIPSTHSEEIPEKISRVQSRKDLAGPNSKVFDILPKLLIAVFIIGAIAVIYYFMQKNADDEAKEPVNTENQTVKYEKSKDLNEKTEEEAKTDEDAQTEESEPEAEEETAPTQEVKAVESNGAETTYELSNTEEFNVKVVSTGETWVNILNGKGYSFFQGMLKKGETESQTVDFSKETEAVIVVGNAANTEIYVNDEKIEYETPPTEIVRQDITIRYNKGEGETSE